MENASKALIMAAGVLMALLILGALVLMFNGLTAYQGESTQNTREAQIIDFNNGYTGYDRDDVRGSELLTLLNKVIDYNERKTSLGTQGAEIAYEPMTIKFSLKSQDLRKTLTYDKTIRLFTSNSYEESGTENQFEKSIENKISPIKNKYGESVIQKLASNITGIYNATTPPIGLEKYNSIVNHSQKKSNFSDIEGEIKTDICKYYEYMQFKRAIFKCTGTKFNQSTGRITQMTFEFTGSFN